MQFQAEHILISGTPWGDLQIRYYGIIIVTAMLVAATIAARAGGSQRGMTPTTFGGGLTWAIFPGIIGARLWFVLFPPISLTATCGPEPVDTCHNTIWFLQNFFNTTNGAIAVWSGGLSIFGAVIGGLLGLWLYFGPLHNTVARIFHYIFLPVGALWNAIAWLLTTIYRRATGKDVEPYQLPRFESAFPDEGMSLLPWLDIAGITLPLAQGIGRWANYVNQELYGLRPSCPGAFRLTLSIVPAVIPAPSITRWMARIRPVFTRCFYMNRFGILSPFLCC